ncbi:MAG: DUF4019 domain-containing protein [Desulfofustis sp.]|nr:DUF4019 domain-containing protein [Desulfofustis sp.]
MRSPSAQVLFLGLFLLIFSLVSAAGPTEIEADAIKGAEVFLQLIDSGQYGASWEKTAPIFRSQVSQERWAEMLSGVRPLFGAMISRDVTAIKFTTSLPGVPDGEYVTIQFASAFEKKAEAIETVTMTRFQSEWQVAGYFIK